MSQTGLCGLHRRLRSLSLTLGLAFGLAFGLGAAPLAAAEVTVFAAASLKTALDQAAAEFTAATGVGVVLSYAATSALARQIEAGAPADLFIAASSDWMDRLDAAGAIDPTSRQDLYGSRIVLIAPGPATKPQIELGPEFDLVGRLGEGPLAMALIDSVPAGIYGRQALQSLGLWDQIEARVAQAENVRAALALVAMGEAPLGIVYASDALAEPRVHVVATIPASAHDPILYQGAVVSQTAQPGAAAGLLDFLQMPAARQIFAAQGFSLPGQ